MKNFKFLLLAVAMSATTSVMASAEPDFRKNKPVTSEIEKMLDRSNLVIEEELSVKVVFSLSEDRRIVIHSIESENEDVNDFLVERLEGREVLEGKWKTGKYYALPVKVQAGK